LLHPAQPRHQAQPAQATDNAVIAQPATAALSTVPALPAVPTEAIVIALPADATLHAVPTLPAVATLLLVSTATAVTRLSLVDTDATVTRLERVRRLNAGSRSSSGSRGRFTARIIADAGCREHAMGLHTQCRLAEPLACNVCLLHASDREHLMQGRNGSQHAAAQDGELRPVPDTFALPDWPRNCWYAAAYDVELGRKLLARRIAGHNVVMYRRRDGAPVALQNACWHRLMPLSEGRLEDDEVACGYHGLVFDSDGRCVFMPSQKTINPAARVRRFPTIERHRFIWLWTGDPTLADPGLVPDLHWNADPAWAGDGRLIHATCGYKLVVDNLMDLTHETFVHGSSIGQRSITEVPFEVTHGPNSATVTRWMTDVEPPPFWRMQLEWKTGVPAGRVDRWQIINFQPPSTVAIDVGVAPTGTGAPEGDRSQGVNGFVLNTMTPETPGTCHYFWAFVRNYNLSDQRITTLIREGVTGVFGEDEQVLAAQQAAIDDHPGKQFYNLNIDGGAMWARRLIDRMLARELDDERYRQSVADASAQDGTTTRVEATAADAARLGIAG